MKIPDSQTENRSSRKHIGDTFIHYNWLWSAAATLKQFSSKTAIRIRTYPYLSLPSTSWSPIFHTAHGTGIDSRPSESLVSGTEVSRECWSFVPSRSICNYVTKQLPARSVFSEVDFYWWNIQEHYRLHSISIMQIARSLFSLKYLSRRYFVFELFRSDWTSPRTVHDQFLNAPIIYKRYIIGEPSLPFYIFFSASCNIKWNLYF